VITRRKINLTHDEEPVRIDRRSLLKWGGALGAAAIAGTALEGL
jgi:hypothetical protein